MSDELLPESIRGGWYFVPADDELGARSEATGEVLVFTLSGEFYRFELVDGARELDEEGDYTFDGQFLILRGSDTNTYRVEPEAPWRWYLEAKKDDQLLLRGWTDREEPLELDEERLVEIENVPAQVFVRSEFEGPERGEICSLVHESGGEQLMLGACYAEPESEGEVWVALVPFTRSLPDALWERIIRRSYLDIYRDDDLDAESVAVIR